MFVWFLPSLQRPVSISISVQTGTVTKMTKLWTQNVQWWLDLFSLHKQRHKGRVLMLMDRNNAASSLSGSFHSQQEQRNREKTCHFYRSMYVLEEFQRRSVKKSLQTSIFHLLRDKQLDFISEPIV